MQAVLETADDEAGQDLPEAELELSEQPEAKHNSSGTHEVMRTKNFFLKPMSVEAAVEQCDQLGHDFYVFREPNSDQVQVVYKRRTTGYGVIVPINEE